MTREPFIAHSELTNEIYIVQGQNKYRVTEQVIHAVKAIKALEQEPTAKNDLGVDWESYKDVDGNCLDDLILEVLQNNFDCGNTYGYKVADEIIGLLPSVTPQEPRWIPVSERLPEDRREVLVTAYWHETYQVMMASYYGDGLWWCVPFNNCGEHMQRLKPKAWMPLLQPYREVEG